MELLRALVTTAGHGRYPELSRLLHAERPSIGLRQIQQAGLLRLLPELWALVGLEQDPRWHPEGDAWVHTLLVVDEAARQADGLSPREREILLFAALCHDLGKPQTTERDGERIRSIRHEPAGEAPTRALLCRLDAPAWLAPPVCALVRRHLAPVTFVTCGAKARAYRRLERRLEGEGASVELLLRVARADQLGRGPGSRFEEGDLFERRWLASRCEPSRSPGRPR
jgi:tRNA nucleotidyltransferase (CCA-adding enzyme)